MSEVKTKGKREVKQEEMFKVPQDTVANAAELFLEWRDERERITENMTAAELNLIEEMKKSGRDSIKIQGVRLILSHKEAEERISIRKAKEEKR